MNVKYKSVLICILVFSVLFFSSCINDDYDNNNDDVDVNAKPVIYLYPEKETKVYVALNYNGKLTCTYPESNGIWEVLAKSDGTLTNIEDGKEYSYLFWEGISDIEYDFTEGFVVKGEDTKDFLQEKLSYMGLIPREYNEFIVYWLPQMKDNKYNLISFQGESYIKNAELTITPKPDSILRVYMAYKAINEPIQIKEQKLKPFERSGFTVIEWGGTRIKN